MKKIFFNNRTISNSRKLARVTQTWLIFVAAFLLTQLTDRTYTHTTVQNLHAIVHALCMCIWMCCACRPIGGLFHRPSPKPYMVKPYFGPRSMGFKGWYCRFSVMNDDCLISLSIEVRQNRPMNRSEFVCWCVDFGYDFQNGSNLWLLFRNRCRNQ